MDKITSAARSENMRRIRSKGTQPEMAVRRTLHALGYRYRLHASNLPGKPDLVFVSAKKVVFVHGCFWHQHASRNCRIKRSPKSNTDYWLPKLARNCERDKKNLRLLRSLGWTCFVVWECQISSDGEISESTMQRLLLFLST